MSDLKTVIESVKTLDPVTIVRNYGGFPVKPIRTGYKTHCASQQHGAQTFKKNSEPVAITLKGNSWSWRCYGCGCWGSAIDWVGYCQHSNWTKPSPPDEFKKVIAELSGRELPRIEKYTEPRQKADLAIDGDLLLEWSEKLEYQPDLLEWLAKRGIRNPLKYGLGFTGDSYHREKWERRKLAIPHFMRDFITAVKLRNPPPKGGYFGLDNNAFLIPYNGDILSYPQKEVYLVETELDAIALLELGKQAVAMPVTYWSRFSCMFLTVKKLILMPDNDAGGETLTAAVRKVMQWRLKVIKTPDGVKDLGAWLMKFPNQYPEWIHV